MIFLWGAKYLPHARYCQINKICMHHFLWWGTWGGTDNLWGGGGGGGHVHPPTSPPLPVATPLRTTSALTKNRIKRVCFSPSDTRNAHIAFRVSKTAKYGEIKGIKFTAPIPGQVRGKGMKFGSDGYRCAHARLSCSDPGENALRGSNTWIGYKIACEQIPIKGLNIRDAHWFPGIGVSKLSKTSSWFTVLFRKWFTRMMYRPQWHPPPPPPGILADNSQMELWNCALLVDPNYGLRNTVHEDSQLHARLACSVPAHNARMRIMLCGAHRSILWRKDISEWWNSSASRKKGLILGRLRPFQFPQKGHLHWTDNNLLFLAIFILHS